MTLVIPNHADLTAPCAEGALAARLRLAGVPAPLWFATFTPKHGCTAVRPYEAGPYADEPDYAAAHKARDIGADLAVIAQETPHGAGVWLSGPNRSGKSHIAAAQVRLMAELAEAGTRDSDCFWINELDFVQFVYDGFDPATRAPKVSDLIRYLTTPTRVGWRTGRITRVVYDDAGAQFDYGSVGARWIGELLTLINALAAAGIALTLTTNVSDEYLSRTPEEGGFGPRVGERLAEMAGQPVVLFPRVAVARAARPRPFARCTCADHATAAPPTSTPATFIEVLRGAGPVQVVPPRWGHFYPEYTDAPQDLNSKNTIPDHFVPISPEKRAHLFASITAVSRQMRLADDPYAADGDAARDRAGDGLYCHQFGAQCDAQPGHTDPHFPGWSVIHAQKWHKPYPPVHASAEQEAAS